MTLSKDARILWQTAKALALKSQAVSPRPRPLPPLLLFTDPERTPDPVQIVSYLPSGSGVIYRHFGAADAEQVAQRLRHVTKAAGLTLLIGLDHDLAAAVEADGVHLPERALHQSASLRDQYPDWLITGAVHEAPSLSGLKGLDAVVISPVFPAGGRSATKPDLGLEGFNRLIALAPCPVYGLGGITPERAPRLLETKACGIAGVDALVAAFKPAN